ncbi:hypothetical protein [Chondrinema litorale]|uniref:hypothetical protein n=1 Tax=Chondrinema litorale TaxID=2994555 RepID=UPI002543E818|nr:hypothetical protein [Chondrinema litorale]UZS00152.1 hypothetical protein OQ292_40295 [Chondrinema litorale]
MGNLAIWLVVLMLVYILLSIAIYYSIYLFWEGGLKILSNSLLLKVERSKYILKSFVLEYQKSFYDLKGKIIKDGKRESQLFYTLFKKRLSYLPYIALFFAGKQKN